MVASLPKSRFFFVAETARTSQNKAQNPPPPKRQNRCYRPPCSGSERSEASAAHGGAVIRKTGTCVTEVDIKDNAGCKTRGVARSFAMTKDFWGGIRRRPFIHSPHSWISSSCNIDLGPAICSGGRRPRSTADGGRIQRSAKGRDRRRLAAGVGACRASRARTRAEAPIQVRKGPFDPPLCVSPLVCPSGAMLLPSSAIRHAIAPLRPAQVPCRLND